MLVANILLSIGIAYGARVLFKDIIKLKKEVMIRDRLKCISTKSSISLEEFNDLLSIRA